MSIDRPVPVPKTAVPYGIDDPVEKARTELKATLAAIELKANVPRRVAHEADKQISAARRFTDENPAAATLAVVGFAVTVGVAVWGAVRLFTR